MILRSLLKAFFSLLYHPLAFTYDWVAAAVSLGHWQDWVFTALPYLEGPRILELGHGPGHLQQRLLTHGTPVIGLDESGQMGRIARRRLGTAGRLVRGLAQSLPFPGDAFQTIVATFPTEYIFDADSLAQIHRCLSPGGRLVVLPAAWPKPGLLKWLFRSTGQTPFELSEPQFERLRQPFARAGLKAAITIHEVQSGSVLIICAEKEARHY